jgi:hypothetical protein
LALKKQALLIVAAMRAGKQSIVNTITFYRALINIGSRHTNLIFFIVLIDILILKNEINIYIYLSTKGMRVGIIQQKPDQCDPFEFGGQGF